MKTILLNLTVFSILITALAFTSCRQTTTAEKDAEAKVQEAQENLNIAEEAATEEQWAAYRADAEAKINSNQNAIAEFRKKMKRTGEKTDALYEKNIDALELKNKELNERMDAFSKSSKSNWNSFKKEFDHDMDEIGKALKDLTVNNEK